MRQWNPWGYAEVTGQERRGFQQQLLAQESQLTLLYWEGSAVSRSRILHFFSGSASGHIYAAEHSAAQGFWSCPLAVVVLVSQQEYSVCLEYYSNVLTVFAPLFLTPRWFDECKVSSLPLCRAVLCCVFPPALRSIKKINYDIYEGFFINFDLRFLICGVLFILEFGEAFKADFIYDAFLFSWLTVLIFVLYSFLWVPEILH